MKYTVSSPPWESMHFGVYNSNFQLHHLKYTVSCPQTWFRSFNNNPCSIHHLKYTISCAPWESVHFGVYHSNIRLHLLTYTVWSPQARLGPTYIRYYIRYDLLNTPYEVHHFMSSLSMTRELISPNPHHVFKVIPPSPYILKVIHYMKSPSSCPSRISHSLEYTISRTLPQVPCLYSCILLNSPSEVPHFKSPSSRPKKWMSTLTRGRTVLAPMYGK